jgi:hypothetical protein
MSAAPAHAAVGFDVPTQGLRQLERRGSTAMVVFAVFAGPMIIISRRTGQLPTPCSSCAARSLNQPSTNSTGCLLGWWSDAIGRCPTSCNNLGQCARCKRVRNSGRVSRPRPRERPVRQLAVQQAGGERQLPGVIAWPERANVRDGPAKLTGPSFSQWIEGLACADAERATDVNFLVMWRVKEHQGSLTIAAKASGSWENCSLLVDLHDTSPTSQLQTVHATCLRHGMTLKVQMILIAQASSPPVRKYLVEHQRREHVAPQTKSDMDAGGRIRQDRLPWIDGPQHLAWVTTFSEDMEE